MTLAMWRLISIRCAEHAAAALVTMAVALVAAVAAEQMPIPPASAAPKDDGQWTMAAKNYAATRFSELDQINGGNVANLRAEFTFSTGVNKGQEAAPLIVNNTMYIVTAYPNILFALDLTKPGAPLKWEYQPHPAAASQGVACCDVVNRGAAFWDG
jgi:lanthanide-dependent methanol dehydrogenase